MYSTKRDMAGERQTAPRYYVLERHEQVTAIETVRFVVEAGSEEEAIEKFYEQDWCDSETIEHEYVETTDYLGAPKIVGVHDEPPLKLSD